MRKAKQVPPTLQGGSRAEMEAHRSQEYNKLNSVIGLAFGTVVVMHTVLAARIMHLFGELSRVSSEHARDFSLSKFFRLGQPSCYKQVLSACDKIGSRETILLARLLRMDMGLLILGVLLLIGYAILQMK